MVNERESTNCYFVLCYEMEKHDLDPMWIFLFFLKTFINIGKLNFTDIILIIISSSSSSQLCRLNLYPKKKKIFFSKKEIFRSNGGKQNYSNFKCFLFLYTRIFPLTFRFSFSNGKTKFAKAWCAKMYQFVSIWPNKMLQLVHCVCGPFGWPMV